MNYNLNLNIKSAIIIVIILILLFYIILISYNTYYNNGLMTGFWKAPDDFLQDSALNQFIIYIGRSSFWSANRSMYLIAQNMDGEMILNSNSLTRIMWDYTTSDNWRLCPYKPRHGVILFDETGCDAFPRIQNIVYNPVIGKLQLYAGDVIYGTFYKEPLMTELSFLSELKQIKCPCVESFKDDKKEDQPSFLKSCANKFSSLFKLDTQLQDFEENEKKQTAYDTEKVGQISNIEFSDDGNNEFTDIL